MLMYRIKPKRVGAARLGEQRAGRGGALGEVTYRLPGPFLAELADHRTALAHPRGRQGGLLAGSLTPRGGEEQAALVEPLPQRRLGHIAFLPSMTGAPHTEKQVSWPLEKALLRLCQGGGEFVLRWRQSLT